jgi:hypothetical protein
MDGPRTFEDQIQENTKKEEETVPRTIPNDKFRKLMDKVGTQHFELFKKLAE